MTHSPATGERWRRPRRVSGGCSRAFPDIPIEDAWGGPIDVSPNHLPSFGRLDPPHLFYALGYTGNGVAPSHLAGRVLADLIIGDDTDATRLPMVDPKLKLFPPDPIRTLGAALIRRALIADEDAAELGRKPNPLAAAVARLPRRLGYLLGPGVPAQAGPN